MKISKCSSSIKQSIKQSIEQSLLVPLVDGGIGLQSSCCAGKSHATGSGKGAFCIVFGDAFVLEAIPKLTGLRSGTGGGGREGICDFVKVADECRRGRSASSTGGMLMVRAIVNGTPLTLRRSLEIENESRKLGNNSDFE